MLSLPTLINLLAKTNASDPSLMSLMLANEPPNYRFILFIVIMALFEQRDAVVRVTCCKELAVIADNHLEHS